MGIVETANQRVEPAYDTAVSAAAATRHEAYEKIIGEEVPDRSETLQTTDPELALVHFLGTQAFYKGRRLMHVFGMFTGKLGRRDENAVTPLLLVARMDPQQQAEAHTSLALIPSGPLMFESSIETTDTGKQRQFSLVGKTATIPANMIRRPHRDKDITSPAHPQAVVTETLPLRHYFTPFVPVKRDINCHDDEIVERDHELLNVVSVGWQAIAAQRFKTHYDAGRGFEDNQAQSRELQGRYFQILVRALGVQATAAREIYEAEKTIWPNMPVDSAHTMQHLAISASAS